MNKTIIYFVSIIILIFLVWLGLRWLVIKVSSPPATLGMTNGRFAPCPGTPNCVSSQEDRSSFQTEPIPYLESKESTHTKLLQLIADHPKMELIQDDGDYLHVTARTTFWGFIDDIQFYFNDADKQIEIRSAARLGAGDFGVNASYTKLFRQQMLPIKNK